MANIRKNIADLTAKLWVDDELSQAEKERRVRAVLGGIRDILASGDDYYSPELGYFNVIARAPVDRDGRNPNTGETIRITKPRRLGLNMHFNSALKKSVLALPLSDAFDVKTKAVKTAVDTSAESVIEAIDTQAMPAPEAQVEATEPVVDAAVATDTQSTAAAVTQNGGA